MNRALNSLLLALLLAALVTPVLAQDETAESDTETPVEATSAEPVATTPPAQAETPSLEQAYQREFAFLQGQKRDLERRLMELRSRIDRERGGLQAEIRGLEAEVVDMRGQADRLDTLVFESERAVETARDNTDLLASTFLQADFTLGDAYAPSHGDAAPGTEDVAALFDAAADVLRDHSSVTRSDGEFFLAEGTRVSGQIIRVGQIAAYGISPQGQGALAPAGDGELKLWPEAGSAEVATALAAGQRPDSLAIFAYESLANEVETRDDKSVIDVIRDGGLIGWIIVWLGVIGVLLIVLRVFFLQRASASTGRIIDSVSAHVKRGDRDAALAVLKKKSGSTSRVVASAIRNLDRDRDHLEDIVSESILHESSHLNRFGAVILVIAAVSPLLGLLGTVTGMISTFDVITEFGTGDPKLLSGGISIALVTTQLGLIVAIPLLLLGNVLSGWAERIKDDMEKAALRVINQYLEARHEKASGAA
ncbi:MotA/TolQ/ExbB proton channel family protein [Wenzhouxiangella marina]|uniref:MotA/TolQ/ExbB proton channel n=1 Tax=Wenzhouxiangella marina TaxID=1579979 RepID=A0A0K0XX78_9GAMM|nr:MotA/TolQ/ExbB proton channel family protein [Wenzhouxiangella marina]AKS42232.1 MotA/TolQ/ExbB proton channel [Wenzhouxiangella marina]MBB6085996.1 biopolymer transport protein ExbB [Wenzhouxiangella marina]